MTKEVSKMDEQNIPPMSELFYDKSKDRYIFELKYNEIDKVFIVYVYKRDENGALYFDRVVHMGTQELYKIIEEDAKMLNKVKVTRAEYEKIVRGESVEKDGKVIQYDPIEEVHKPTKEQIKEVLDAIADYCDRRRCFGCPFCDDYANDHCILGRPYSTWDAEDIAEVIADERS